MNEPGSGPRRPYLLLLANDKPLSHFAVDEWLEDDSRTWQGLW